MKNTLLNTLLNLHYHAETMCRIYAQRDDETAKDLHNYQRREANAYWWALAKHYGRKKASQKIAYYKEIKDAQGL
jgi:hypothetical protein